MDSRYCTEEWCQEIRGVRGRFLLFAIKAGWLGVLVAVSGVSK